MYSSMAWVIRTVGALIRPLVSEGLMVRADVGVWTERVSGFCRVP